MPTCELISSRLLACLWLLVPGGHGEIPLHRSDGRPPNRPPRRLASHATPSLPDLNRCISHIPPPFWHLGRSATMQTLSTQIAPRCDLGTATRELLHPYRTSAKL